MPSSPWGAKALTSTPDSLHALSSAACGPAAVPDNELSACTDIIYRPWFSPYSYLLSAKEATEQHLRSLATSPQEHEELDDLSVTVCSSGSSDSAQPPARDGLASSSSSITIQDILTASQQQPLPQQGYKCMSCCRLFPRLWSVKAHIRNSSQEGYSCKVYYRRLKALWEREQRAQGAAAPGAAPAAEQPPREGTAPSLLPTAQ